MKIPTNLFRKKSIKISGLILLMIISIWIGSKMGSSGGDGHNLSKSATEEKSQSTVWTCSMHPQIKMPKPGQCPICFMDLIPLETGKSGSDGTEGVTRLSMSENARVLAGIVTAPAVRRNINADIRMTGKLAFDETRVEMITARIAGRIDKLFVDYVGVAVKSGDHLAQIYSPELVSLQRELLVAAQSFNRLGPDISDMVRSSANKTFAATKEKLRLLGFSEQEMQQVLSRGKTSDHMTIRAGQSGVVLRKLVEEGAYVQTGSPIIHIGDLKKLWVLLDAYESDVAQLRTGQKAEFTVEAFPGRTFTGTVSFIDPVIDPATRTVKVRVIVNNEDGSLKPDMFVKAQVKASMSGSGKIKNVSLRGKWISPMHPQIVKDKPGTCDICGMPLVRAEELGYVTSGFEDVEPLLIPATAPLYTGDRSLVYVEISGTEEPTYEAREVVLGPRMEGYYIVKSGVAEGEMVVVNGAFKIDGELQIRAKPSMMSPDGGVAATGHEGHDMSGSSKSSMKMPEIPPVSDKPVSKEFTTAMQKLVDQYFTVADALAKDDDKGAKQELIKFQDNAQSIKVPAGDQYKAWNSVKEALLKALTHTNHIAELGDARSIFDGVSKQIILIEKHYLKDDGVTHHLAFCSMAFNNNGAYWVQKEDSIRNPYFGAGMLKCGEIKEKL